ncbi:plastidic glucose transporter 4-like [Hibiscus syriacus]|uniref:plastidic glucose transporter 4-like n=1 Tax=Hibiscus syriacus TaxID=106335 RepID=UPI001920AF4D|nr:plastidic glucose transporter 4-like [Hibiscus syriacus]
MLDDLLLWVLVLHFSCSNSLPGYMPWCIILQLSFVVLKLHQMLLLVLLLVHQMSLAQLLHPLMDRQGRKSLLIIAGMGASMLLLSLSFTWKILAPYSGMLAVVGTVLYVLSFSLGAGLVPALLLPELFASRIRAKAVALSLGTHWVSCDKKLTQAF